MKFFDNSDHLILTNTRTVILQIFFHFGKDEEFQEFMVKLP